MKKLIYYLTLSLLLLLTGLSIYGAFVGAERARRFFNSLPMVVFWIFAAILIIASLVFVKRLRKPSVLLMHLGAVLVILGSMSASEKAHEIRRRLFNRQKPVDSLMLLYEGQSGNELYERSTNSTFQLPFDIHLDDFIVQTYAPYLIVELAGGRMAKMPAEIGADLAVGGNTIRVVNVFENFRIRLENGQSEPFDSEESGYNPAVELAVTRPDGSVYRQFVFELLHGHDMPNDNLRFSYYRPVKDYISRVDIVRDGTVIKSAAIEVNHPLHFGGFHFYQYSYDDKQHQYTILRAVSDDGLNAVYAGYGLLCFGVFWYFWFIRLRRG